MKNFTRRRGTGVAAAALSLALVAPFTQSVAGAEDGETQSVTAVAATEGNAGTEEVKAGDELLIENKQFATLGANTPITLTFNTTKGKVKVDVTPTEVNGKKVLKVKVPEGAQSGTVVVAFNRVKIEVPIKVKPEAATTTAVDTTTPATSSSTTATTTTTTPAPSSSTTTPASSSSTTEPAASGSSITDNDKCRTAVLGWGIPLAVLVPVGLLASAAVPGLRALRHAAGDFVREANAQFQNQIGVMNPELAALQANFNDQLRQFNTDITQLAFGAAFLGLGVGALAHLGTACSPAATVIPTKATTTKTEKPETPTQKPTQENSTPKTTEPAAEVTTSSSSAAEPTTSETTEEPTKEPEAESQQ